MPNRASFHAALLAMLFLWAPGLILARADVAPDWSLQDLTGKTVRLSDFKGKVVILDFWATWCPPCRAEIPHFIALQEKYDRQGLIVIGVSVDQTGLRSVADFALRNQMTYPIVMGDQATAESYGGVEVIPTTFVIDRQGNIVGRHVGFTDEKIFEAEIQKKSLIP